MTLTYPDLVATAGLLHDLGKFRQRAGVPGSHAELGACLVDELADLFQHECLDDLRDAVGNHHRPPRKEIEKLVKLADWLASGERETGEGLIRQESHEAALVPLTAQVDLFHAPPGPKWSYRLGHLDLYEGAIFPELGATNTHGDYAQLWEAFKGEASRAPALSARHQFHTLLALLRKYTALIPSATPWEEDEEHRTLPDISLYDHLKATAAIAVCLTRVLPDTVDALLRRDDRAWSEPVCLVARGDLSGIQAFLYRITQPGAEARGTAKRLRGRSLFLLFLVEAIGFWLMKELDVPPVNLLHCGGGRLDMLAPLDRGEVLASCAHRLEQWLVREFGGTLGFQLVWRPTAPREFAEFGPVYEALDAALVDAKRRKFASSLEAGFPEAETIHDLCPVCRLTPVPEPSPCPLCMRHRELGEAAPKTTHILWTEHGVAVQEARASISWGDPLNAAIHLLLPEEAGRAAAALARGGTPAVLWKLNDTAFLPAEGPGSSSSVALAFRFLANAAPLQEDGTVLDFQEMVGLARGAGYLGVLRADVDRLGAVFRRGIRRQSISRLATLSSLLDLFFSGWLNRLAERVSAGSRQEGAVPNVLYTVYAGGDDLFVVGPWDATVRLAHALQADFTRFCCQNANLTVSAGLVFVKPHFPVQRFAELSGNALDAAKGGGRNRIHLFGETVCWHDGALGLENLLKLGEDLAGAVEREQIPRTLVHDLLRLHRQYFRPDGTQALGWASRALYAIARRVKPDVIGQLDLLHRIPGAMGRMRVPASYVILATRGR